MNTSMTGACACDAAAAFATASAFRAEAAYSKASDIVIETLEGDRVTLSASAYAAGGYETYETYAAEGGAAAWQYGTSACFESGQALSLSVSGDLNARELADIGKILKTLDGMMNKLAAGDLEGALAGSAKFAGIDSIASFSADMRITASVAVSRYEAAAASIPLPAAEGENGHAYGRIDRAAENLSRKMGPESPGMGNIVKTLEKYFSDWFEARSDRNEEYGGGMKWAARFARRLMEGLLNGQGPQDSKSGGLNEGGGGQKLWA